jgi:hypothetical protein
VSKESSKLLHLRSLATGGTKPKMLKTGGSKNERPVIPESNSVCHRRIPIRKQVLKLVRLEDIRNCFITTVLGPV